MHAVHDLKYLHHGNKFFQFWRTLHNSDFTRHFYGNINYFYNYVYTVVFDNIAVANQRDQFLQVVQVHVNTYFCKYCFIIFLVNLIVFLIATRYDICYAYTRVNNYFLLNYSNF